MHELSSFSKATAHIEALQATRGSVKNEDVESLQRKLRESHDCRLYPGDPRYMSEETIASTAIGVIAMFILKI